MLSMFPEFLTLGLLAPFIIRVVLGLVILNLGYLKLNKERKEWETSFKTIFLKPAGFWVSVLGLIEVIGGILLMVGAFTQLVALIFAVITLSELALEIKQREILKRGFVFYLLLFACSASLVFSGAGFFAIDLPL